MTARTNGRLGPIAVAAILVALVAAGCSTPNEPAPTSASGVSVHPTGWATAGSADFHGDALGATGYELGECAQCHGAAYDGGIAGVACFTCHGYPHPAGWGDPQGAFHGDAIVATNWSLIACRACHGDDYGAVKNGVSCATCHTAPEGPESCNTCHGDFGGDPADLASAAPPAGLRGETDPAVLAVGAHAFHLAYDTTLAVAATCAECHAVPSHLDSSGHLDGDDRAEAPLGGPRANTVTEGGTRVPTPTWDPAAGTCSNTYCHGNWGLRAADSGNSFMYQDQQAGRIQGNSAAPVWNDPSTAPCGSCHDLPPAGHVPRPIEQCGTCHIPVVDGQGNIIDRTRHANGMVDVFGEQYPMF